MNRPNEKLPSPERAGPVFAGLFGAFLGLSLLKFGNPGIMEKWVLRPGNIYEFLLGYPWPIGWGYGALTVLVLIGLFCLRWNRAVPIWVLVLPVAWLAWELLAGTQSISRELTLPTLEHFVSCVVCFYLGVFCLNYGKNSGLFWTGILAGFALVLAIGWEQHFGGLESSRRYFYLYIYPHAVDLPPEYLKKLSSTRIFATLFYPNALAGAVLLLLPPSLGILNQARRQFTSGARMFLMVVFVVAALGCLYWSGSKGGWLLLLLAGLLALWQSPVSRTLRLTVVGLILVAGLAGFFWKYSGFFKKGATSVVARFDYWRAAVETVREHPLLGTGPGTFAIPYQRLKRPESEMARLVHNDYLEQASDSGLPGCAAYTTWIVMVLVTTRPRRPVEPGPPDIAATAWHEYALWLGLLAWALQGLVEFGLYLPGLAWPGFTLMGALVSQTRAGLPAEPRANLIDKRRGAHYAPPRQ